MFLFSLDAKVIACAVNAPGSMHDRQIAEWGGVYEKLSECFNEFSGRCIVDSAFAKGVYPFLIKSARDETNAERAEEVIQIRQATSARQAYQWGMRALQGSLLHIKDRFYYEDHGERKFMVLSLADV